MTEADEIDPRNEGQKKYPFNIEFKSALSGFHEPYT